MSAESVPPNSENGEGIEEGHSPAPPKSGAGRDFLSGGAGIAVLLAANALGVWWLGATQFDGNAFYDGSALIVTLALPALLGGLVLGWFARDRALSVAAAAFGAFCLAGFLHPFWRIPRVSAQSAHSGLLHYFLYIPLVALAFGALGAWLSSSFATGRWTLADREPVTPAKLED